MDELEALRHELLAAAVSPELAALVDTMSTQNIPVASQLETVRRITAVANGTAHNGYTMARIEGLSRSEARSSPATSSLLAITDFLGADAATFRH